MRSKIAALFVTGILASASQAQQPRLPTIELFAGMHRIEADHHGLEGHALLALRRGEQAHAQKRVVCCCGLVPAIAIRPARKAG